MIFVRKIHPPLSPIRSRYSPCYQTVKNSLFCSFLICATGIGPSPTLAQAPTGSEFPTYEVGFAAACSEVSAARLAPGHSLRKFRFEGFEMSRPNLTDYLGWSNPILREEEQRRMAASTEEWTRHRQRVRFFAGHHPIMYTAQIAYEITAPSGTATETRAKCTMVDATPEEFTEGETAEVRVDGWSAAEWKRHLSH